jgi:hypothetical protein
MRLSEGLRHEERSMILRERIQEQPCALSLPLTRADTVLDFACIPALSVTLT